MAPTDEELTSLSHEELVEEVVRLRDGIRQHRDGTGHDLCWHHPHLWGLLPEATDPLPDVPEWPQFEAASATASRSMSNSLLQPE